MSLPQEICLEELHRSSEEEPFIRCVALPGAEPGLCLDREGEVQWMPEAPEAYGLCVSADGQLVLLRGAGTGPVVVERQQRSLEAPVGQPVVLRDQDVLCLGDRRLRVHLHGETEAVVPPERITRSALARLARAAAAAATLALGAAGATAAASPATEGARGTEPAPIEVRTRPPVVAPRRVAVDCKLDGQQRDKQGALVIHATCPRPRGLYVGLGGSLLDAKGQPVKDGWVRITAVTKAKVVATAPRLKQRVKAAKVVRFWVTP